MSRFGYAELLPEEDPRVVAGPAGQLADHLVALSPIESGSLIAVRVEVHLVAAAAHGFSLGRGQDARAEPAPAQILADPERLHESGSAEGPPVHAGDDLPARVADADREPAAVVVHAAGRRGGQPSPSPRPSCPSP